MKIWMFGAALALSACGTATANNGAAANAGAAVNSATPANGGGSDTTLAGLPWAGFYEKANEEYAAGNRDEAVTLFYVGQLRGRVVVACQNVPRDRDPALLASLNESVGRVMNEYAGGSPAGWAAAIDRALAYDSANPDPNAASAECRAERERQRTGLTELRDHILANVEQIREQRTANGLPNR